MTLFTNNLLINLLFLIIMCFVANISFGYFENRILIIRWLHCFLGVVAIIISILLGIQIHGIRFDLRQIPFIIVSLREGPFVSLILLSVTVLTRSFFGGHGTLYNLIVNGFITLFIIKLRPIFLKSNFLEKLLHCLSLSFFCSLSQLICLQIFDHQFLKSKELLINYLIIPQIGMILLLSISEGMKRYFLLKKEIFEAEKGKVITHLAASFGHEVRNPITATKGFLQLLLEKDITYEKRVLYAQTALDELKHSEMIISNYLTFAKPHVKKKKIFDFREEIEIVVETVFPMANMNNIVVNLISVSNISSKWIIDGERNLLHQCLLNILKNSIEAMPNGGVLKVELVRLERLIGVSISDTGIGMSNDQIKRLGESYFSSKEKGTGLGMMVVYSIIKAMKGSIKVESEIGKGTTFTLLFPETPFAQLNDVDSADIDNKSKANYGKRHYDLSTIESGEKKCR